MKIDICSDLHIIHAEEINWEEMKNPTSTVLVVAGDISPRADKLIGCLSLAKKYYEKVFFVDGNHEHYNHYEV